MGHSVPPLLELGHRMFQLHGATGHISQTAEFYVTENSFKQTDW